MNLKEYKVMIEKYLDKAMPPAVREPKILHEAMRYSVFSGGKRLRPAIVLLTGKIFSVSEKKLLPAACGIELIHNFSLVHDDLPGMDNDDFRRGRPTCHKKFGEAIAILAGDALLTLGFELIAKSGSPALIRDTAAAIGSEGMAGGQAMDVEFKDRKITDRLKKKIDGKKTGRLFELCFTAPLFFRKTRADDREKIKKIAENFGVAFQVRDDIEDEEGDAGHLKRRQAGLYRKMKKDIGHFGKRGRPLSDIIDNLFS